MLKGFNVLVCAGLMSALSLSSFAESDPPADWLLAKYDLDGDMAISIEEVSQKRERVFSLMDADQDGEVSLDEYAGMDALKREQILRARFGKLDLNRDGQVSADEYSAYAGSFNRFDQDRDGVITAAEIKPEKIQPAPAHDNTRCILWLCVKTKLD